MADRVDKRMVLRESWWEEEGNTHDYGYESSEVELRDDKAIVQYATRLPMPAGRSWIQSGAAEISTRDLVQEYLANKTFPTSSGWGMPKKKEGGKKYKLVWLPFRFKFKKQFKKPCTEWLEMIKNMTVAFGTRPKPVF